MKQRIKALVGSHLIASFGVFAIDVARLATQIGVARAIVTPPLLLKALVFSPLTVIYLLPALI